MAEKAFDMAPPPPGSGPRGLRRPGAKPKNASGTLSRLWDMMRGDRGALAVIFALAALGSAASMFSPLLLGRAVAAVAGGSASGLKALMVLLVALYLGIGVVDFAQHFFMAAVSQRIVHRIRCALFADMKLLPLAFFDAHTHGELMSRLTNDVDNVSTTISNSLAMLFTQVVTVIGIFCLMVAMSPLLTVVALGGAALIMALVRVITSHTHDLFAARARALGRLNGQVEESVSGLAVVKAFGREEVMIEQFERYNDELRRVATKALIWSGYLMPLTNVINNLSYLTLAVISGLLAARGTLTIGQVTSFLLYIRQFTRPFVNIANIYNDFQTALAGLERIFQIMDQSPEPADAADALSLERPRGDVELRHVTFGYEQGRPILRDVSLNVPAGTRVAIVGPTGAGKTTLINLLPRFYDVDEGSITLDGHDLREYRRADLRRAFGVVLQDTVLFAGTVRANISYGSEGASEEQIRAAARAAGADSFIECLPDGYDTVLSGGGSEFSQGERQLLTIARAVLADAPILILDEATSSVDTLTEQKIQRAMAAIMRGRTSFIIAHRLSTICDADTIVVIDGGRIAEQGTHAQLLAANGRYAAMYRQQSGE